METEFRVDKKIHLQNRFIKSYKKNTIALFLCFTLSITLITSLLILIHTNYKMETLQQQMLFTEADCSIIGIDAGKVRGLTGDPDVKWYAVQQTAYTQYRKNSQSILLYRGDDSYITLVSRLEAGRLPRAENEVAAERWALLNMGIEPECGQVFELYNEKTGQTESYQLTGILSDMAGNKKYGVRMLYAPIMSAGQNDYTVYMLFQYVAAPLGVIAPKLLINPFPVKDLPRVE